MDITLETQIMRYAGDVEPWSLAEAFADLKAKKINRIFSYGDAERFPELRLGFERAIYTGRTPTVGQTIAAWHYAANDANLAAYIADNSQVTTAQFDARKGAITRR